ncbi:MAG TPA: hypothetical protein VF761_13750 [Gemmatimonadaceae bacterium]
MGKALRRDADAGGAGRGAVASGLRLVALLGALLGLVVPSTSRAQEGAPRRLDAGRFTVVHYPRDERLARTLADAALARDTFPGLARPTQHVLIAIAPDTRRFREWVGPDAPEWGAAIAFPESRRIVLHGRDAGGRAGDPLVTLRHELAHLALHETMGDLPPRWFDEGYASYAAGEWGRDEILETSYALVLRRLPSLDSLDTYFDGGEDRAGKGYALAQRAVSELAALDERRGLALFFQYWKETGSMDKAVRTAYGLTLADFDLRWRERTRRRYGALAFTADFALLGVLGGLTLVPLWLVRRRRDRQRLAAMRAADEVSERLARESMLAELLAETTDAPEVPNDGRDPERERAGGTSNDAPTA